MTLACFDIFEYAFFTNLVKYFQSMSLMMSLRTVESMLCIKMFEARDL